MVLAIPFMVFDFDYAVYGLWFWLCCLWSVVLAIRFMVSEFGYAVDGLWFCCSQRLLTHLMFQSCVLAYLIMVIPEMHHVH